MAMVRGALARMLLRRLRESARRKEEERRRREEEIRRQREEAERRRQEAARKEAEARAKVAAATEAMAKEVAARHGVAPGDSITRVHRSFLLIFCFVFAEVWNSGVFCTCARVLLLRWS